MGIGPAVFQWPSLKFAPGVFYKYFYKQSFIKHARRLRLELKPLIYTVTAVGNLL